MLKRLKFWQRNVGYPYGNNVDCRGFALIRRRSLDHKVRMLLKHFKLGADPIYQRGWWGNATQTATVHANKASVDL